jgi:flagella basal body P-ring formation protein FlgA
MNAAYQKPISEGRPTSRKMYHAPVLINESNSALVVMSDESITVQVGKTINEIIQ